MTLPIEYIKIPASILGRTDLSNTAKMLLGLIEGFGSNGLMLSNPQLARVFHTHPNHITRLLIEIKNYIRTENPQSRYRKIFYLNNNDEVQTDTLKQNGLSNDSPLKHLDTATQAQMLNINKVTKKNNNIISPQETQRFVKPAPEQVQAYAQSIGYTLDGQSFCDYYESRGWMIGKSKMRNWQAAVRTWQRNQNSFGRKNKLPKITQEVKNNGQYKTITA